MTYFTIYHYVVIDFNSHKKVNHVSYINFSQINEKIVYLDRNGRLYIPEEIRKTLQFKTLILKTLGKGLIIEPIEDDPIEALGKLGREKLKGKTIKKLKEEARQEIEKNALKKYTDSDFFLALLKDSDWLKKKAKAVYEKNKNDLWISPFTIVELMIVCIREGIPVRETLYQVSRIAGTTFIKWNFYFRAAEYIERGAGIFDALLMSLAKESEIAFSEESEIISSDKIYEKFGFKVINLR